MTLHFSTDDGSSTNSSQTIPVPLPGTYNLASVVTFPPVTANHITMVVNDNHYGNADGGDRVGIAEIRFLTTSLAEPIGNIEIGGFIPAPGGQGLTLSWPTTDGQLYDVQYKSNLVTQAEWAVYTNVTGTGGSIDVFAAVDHAEGFFRVVTP